MAISVTQLRANIYKIVDEIIETGQPIDIEREGMTLRIIPLQHARLVKANKLERLIQRREVMTSSPEDYVHIDWSDEWKP